MAHSHESVHIIHSGLPFASSYSMHLIWLLTQKQDQYALHRVRDRLFPLPCEFMIFVQSVTILISGRNPLHLLLRY